MKIGYARVSTASQSEARQLKALHEEGCERVFVDKVSGKTDNREEFNMMRDMVQEGDVIVVTELSRVMRSLSNFIKFMDELRVKGVYLTSLKERWVDTRDDNPSAELMRNIFAAFADFERKMIVNRAAEGLAIAKANNVQLGRKRNDEKTSRRKAEERAMEMKLNGIPVSEITRRTGVSKATLYRRLKERQLY